MRFERICPECYKKWQSSMPDWVPNKIKMKPKPSPNKPQAIHQRIEGNDIVITVYYPLCGHRIETRRPYKNVNTIDGYIMVHSAKGYMPEHRFVWEQVHGSLPNGHVVHHINGIKADNRIENLIALPRIKHNNHMMQPTPTNIKCPHCGVIFKVIKRSGKEFIPI